MWKDLTDEQKVQYKQFCDKHFGETNSFSQDGEPLYFDKNMMLINASQIITLLLTTEN